MCGNNMLTEISGIERYSEQNLDGRETNVIRNLINRSVFRMSK
jgi:hypothetical protein